MSPVPLIAANGIIVEAAITLVNPLTNCVSSIAEPRQANRNPVSSARNSTALGGMSAQEMEDLRRVAENARLARPSEEHQLTETTARLGRLRLEKALGQRTLTAESLAAGERAVEEGRRAREAEFQRQRDYEACLAQVKKQREEQEREARLAANAQNQQQVAKRTEAEKRAEAEKLAKAERELVEIQRAREVERRAREVADQKLAEILAEADRVRQEREAAAVHGGRRLAGPTRR